jgi:uncharacterized protein (DUF58 family)
VTGRFRDRFKRWLNRRVPPRRRIVLTRMNIFIFPSRAGFAFVGLLLLLWLVATNYENNLVMALVLLLTGLFVVSILHTFSNLSGACVTAIRAQPAFVGEDVEISLLIEHSGRREYENLLFNYPGKPPVIVNLPAAGGANLKLYFKPERRGWVNPGRLLVQTWYPLGLLRAWTWLDLDITALVYPKPLRAGPIPAATGAGEEGELSSAMTGGEDFHGLKGYQPGDSMRHIAWKSFARERGLYTKEYAASIDRRIWIDWDFLAGMDRESRLSRLCYWVLQSEQGTDNYGLRLPGIEIPPARGPAHRNRMLKELAVFELDQYETRLPDSAQ